MKIEFHPDFKTRPRLKASWPKLKDIFKGFSLKSEDYRRMMRTVALILSVIIAALLLILVAAAIIKK